MVHENGHENGHNMDFMLILLTVINRLQTVFQTARSNNSLDLPEIVVVGIQSSGKSSVLEGFVKRNFLPRGEGLVTRCPIILRLIHSPEPHEDGSVEWCVFEHCQDRIWSDFTKIAPEITKQTKILAGDDESKGISKTPITLTIYSPNVVNLTVVDLPGMVKVPQGTQPVDIEAQVLALIMDYISRPTTIILAVSAADCDIAASESIKLAKEVDPAGNRTLAVITKLDKADGHKMKDVLAGDVISLKYGLVGVVNQSDRDRDAGVTFDQVRAREETLLRRKYPVLAARNGSRYLAQRLSRLLMTHILNQLPVIENQISDLTKRNEELLESLGTDDIPHKGNTMSKTILNFCTRYSAEFEATRRHIDTRNLKGATRVKLIMFNIFSEDLSKLDALGDITDDEIDIAILNSSHMETRLTIVEAAYQDLVKTQIKRLLDPCLTCVNSVHEEMQNAIQTCLDPETTFQYPRLSECIIGVVTHFLRKRIDEVIRILKYQVEIESSFIQTSEVDFLKKMYDLLQVPDITRQSHAKHILIKFGPGSWLKKAKTFFSGKPDGNEATSGETQNQEQGGIPKPDLEKSERDIVKELIGMYFEIVRQNFQDWVPKLLTNTIIYYASENLSIYLNDELHRVEKIDDLIRASPEAQQRRVDSRNELQNLREAAAIIKEVREMNLE